MIHPIRHGNSSEAIAVYKVEPYVVAADVYSVAPHTGRGGWTWYTGSAGWMYRLITESLLGIRREADKLRFMPCMPAEWKSFSVDYRYQETTYHIQIRTSETGNAKVGIVVDGIMQSESFLTLVNDLNPHRVEVVTHNPVQPASVAQSVASSSA